MRRLITCFAGVCLFVGFGGASYAQIPTEVFDGNEVVANEVLVKFKEETPPEVIELAKVAEDVDVSEPVGGAGWLRFHSPFQRCCHSHQ